MPRAFLKDDTVNRRGYLGYVLENILLHDSSYSPGPPLPFVWVLGLPRKCRMVRSELVAVCQAVWNEVRLSVGLFL